MAGSVFLNANVIYVFINVMTFYAILHYQRAVYS